MVYQPPAIDQEQQAARQREARQAILAAGQQAMIEPTKPLELPEAPMEPATSSDDFQPLAVVDYSDPDTLKKAILHYEIFGKPLALREPSQETTAF